MASLLEILQDEQFQRDLKKNAGDLAQSASNTIASNVSGPVDVAAWLLRKAGVPVGPKPVMGSDWMEQVGLTPPIQNGAPKVAGETLGLLSSLLATKQGAAGAAKMLNQYGANLAAPRTMNRQAGMLRIEGRGQIPETASDVEKLSNRFGKLLDDANVDYAYDKSNISPARYFMFDNPSTGDAYKVRISDHRNVHGADYSVDPHTGATFEEMLKEVKSIGLPLADRVKVDRSIGKKVGDALNIALGSGEGSLIRAASQKYGGISSDSFKASNYKEIEQKLYELANKPKSEYTKQDLESVSLLLNALK